MNPTDRLYTIKEASEDYFQGKVSGRQVYKLFHEGRLPGFRVGNKILLYKSGLDAYKAATDTTKPTS